jgi:hypothetical protein
MADTPDRLTYITSVRDLADFFDTNPDVPTPDGRLVAYHFPQGTDQEIRAQVDHIAHLLGSQIDSHHLPYGHYSTGIRFGAAEYRAVGLLASARAKHAAEPSHPGCTTAHAEPADNA